MNVGNGGIEMKINVDIGYPSHLLFSNVSFDIPSHGILSFIGENGCGKSTLLKTLAGIIRPLKGNVPSKIISGSYMISDSISLPDEVTVGDIMELLGKTKCDFVESNYVDIFQQIKTMKSQTIRTLSSGQKKIVEIFSCLALHKKYLLLDEASNSLDLTNKELLMNAVASISKKDIVVFYISHNLDEILRLDGDLYCFIPRLRKIEKMNKENMTERKLKNVIMNGVD